MPDGRALQIEKLMKNVGPLVVLIYVLSASSYLLSDLYLPALPQMTEAFGTKATLTQLSMTTYLVSLALFQLLWGPVSDRIGRRKVILIGNFVVILGTLLCVLSSQISVFLLGRLVEGAGAAVLVVMTRAILRDLSKGAGLAKLSAYLGTSNNVVTAFAPVVGSYFLIWFVSWRSIFWALLFVFFLLLIASFFWVEESIREKTTESVARVYGSVLTHRNFMLATLASASGFGGLLAYLTTVPFLYQSVLSISLPVFGWLGMCIIASSLIAKLLSGMLVKVLGVKKLLYVGAFNMVLGATIMLGFVFVDVLNVWVVLLPFMIFNAGLGLLFSNVPAIAMEDFASNAGSAAAVYGCVQILGAVLTTTLVSYLPDHSQTALAIILTVVGLLTASAMALIRWPQPAKVRA